VAVIADRRTDRLFYRSIASALPRGARLVRVAVQPGESSKTLASAERVLEALARARFDRKGAIVALGGGVVSDLAGFVASIYMRGVPWVAVPTTLLAMVDASIGGKTAVDLPSGKNLAGTFWPPRAVMSDLQMLQTLPRPQFVSGLAEVVKIALAADASLFRELERSTGAIARREPRRILSIIRHAASRKGAIVEADERDTGARMILNLGHTTGHALEAALHYKNILHGEAVAIGLCVACNLSMRRGAMDPADAARVTALLRALGLRTAWPRGLSVSRGLRAVASDKKSVGGHIQFILPTAIGASHRVFVTMDELKRAVRIGDIPDFGK
jgi:3-dehydroquinate synthase